ncbi:MAG: hypothetical protein ACRD2W_06205 [Acidimicrobiales bacterium]
MLRDTDVPTMMMRVEATLDAAARSPNGAGGVMRVANEGDHHLNVGKARQLAAIELEFPASSDRALVGKAIAFLKRVLRRSLRWYVTPMIHQQTRFNHAAVDLFEGLRLSVDRLSRRLDALQPPPTIGDGNLLDGCASVLEVVDVGAADLDRLRAVEPGSLDGVLARAASFDPAAVAAVIEASVAALAPGGKLAVATSDVAPVPSAAVAWAAAAAGLTSVRQVPVEPGPPATSGSTASLAEELGRVVRLLAQPRTVAVLAAKPRARP